MITKLRPARAPRPVLSVLLVLAAIAAARAQLPPVQLDPLVTTATRTPADRQTLGSNVEVFTADELARRQINSVSAALGGGTGAPTFQSGTSGAVTSLFLRGANSNQALFLVDGLRLNDPNTDYNVYLGGACVGACDSLEIAHGPQSTLYGGEAVGGVISLRAQRGKGQPTGRVAVEAGSFSTIQGAASAQGESGPNAWALSLQGGHTDNERANNEFDSANVVGRVDRKVSDRVAVGGTVRWFHGAYGSPGDRFTNDPDNEEREENVLATAFVDLKGGPAWTAHATLGGQDRRYVAESPRAGRATTITVIKNRRAVLDTQATYTGVERNRITGGFTAEGNTTRNTGFGNINEKEGLFAVFAQDEVAVTDEFHFTAGLRNDDFDTFGRATTGRATVAWLAVPKTLKLRASYGTAFRSPSFLDLYGQSAFYVGNPNLRPERARGWDVGADYYLRDQRGVFSATWFDTDFTNLIASTPDFRSVMNIQKARTRGAELAAQAAWAGIADARLAYTYLEADNLTTNQRLLRRPKHKFSADLWHDFGRGFSGGAGVAFVAKRRDVDARTFGQIDAEDYTVARVFGAWQVNRRFAVKARLENLCHEKYEEVNGYPALGFGAFGSMEWKF